MFNAKLPSLKRSSVAFLQVIIVLFGLAFLAFLLWEPQAEGVNKNRTQIQIYFNDPFIAYVYSASIPFFVALYQAFRLLGLARHERVISQSAVWALRTIKFCAIAIIVFVIGGEVFIFLHASDDRAGGVFMGVLFSLISAIIATAAATFESILQKAVDLQSENDLTV